jgi:hypothetical protein
LMSETPAAQGFAAVEQTKCGKRHCGSDGNACHMWLCSTGVSAANECCRTQLPQCSSCRAPFREGGILRQGGPPPAGVLLAETVPWLDASDADLVEAFDVRVVSIDS